MPSGGMVGAHDIKMPPSVFPVRPGDALRDKRRQPKRPRKDDQAETEQDRDKPQDDDGRPHIDEYA